VNGVEIAADAIAAEVQHHPAPDPDTAWREAARALAVRELLVQRARALGLEPAPPDPDEAAPQETEVDALIGALLDADVLPEPPDAAACARYYQANRARFRTPDLFEAAHILIQPDGDSPEAWSAAGIETRRIARAVGDDAAAFAEAARAFSACPTAQQDGALGQIRRGELVPEVQAAIEALQPGTTGRTPVRSSHGWHVVRLARRIEGHILPFEAVQDRIADMLAARSWTMQAARYITRLAEAARIEGITIQPEDAA
jgi:peptidyl-prolyl cis-trans isomerase C